MPGGSCRCPMMSADVVRCHRRPEPTPAAMGENAFRRVTAVLNGRSYVVQFSQLN